MANKDLIKGYIKVEDDASEKLKKAGKNIEDLGKKAKKAGKDANDSAKGFQEFAGKLSAVAAPILAIIAVTERLKSSFDFTAQMNQMSSRIGIGVESLSAFSLIAQKNGATAEELGDALKDLSKNVGDAIRTEDVNKFGEIGIQLTKTNGEVKTTEEVFLELSDVFKNHKNDSVEVAKAMELMGDSGLKLLPIMNNGADAIKKQRDELVELGLVLKNETSESIKQLGKDFNEANQTSNVFFSDMVAIAQPAVSEVISILNDMFKTKIFNKEEIKDAQLKFEAFTAGFLKASDVIVDAVKIISGTFSLLFTIVSNGIQTVYNLGQSFYNLQTLNFDGLIKNLRTVANLGKETKEQIDSSFNINNFNRSNLSDEFTKRRENDRKAQQIANDYINQNKGGKYDIDSENRKLLGKGTTQTSLGSTIKQLKIPTGGGGKDKEADKQRKIEEQALKDFIKINEERINEEKRFNQYSLKESEALINLKQKTDKQYLDEKEQIIKKEYDFTIINYKKIRDELEKNIASGKNEKLAKEELIKINEKMMNAERENTINSLTLQYQKIQAFEEYKSKILDVEKQINSLTNNENKNFEIELGIKFKGLEEQFKGDEEALSKLSKLKDLEINNNKYNESLKKIQETNSTLSTQEALIYYNRDQGSLSNVEANRQLLDVRSKLIEQELRTIANIDTTNLSQEQKNDLIMKEIDLKKQLGEADELANETQKMFQSSITKGFEDIINGTKSAKDGFKDLFSSILDNLKNMIAQDWSNQLYKSIFGNGDMFKNFGGALFGSSGNSGGGSSGGSDLMSIIMGMMGGGDSGGGGVNWAGIVSSIAGFFDSGGSMQKNRPYMVGEFGKELFVPNGSGTLYSNAQTSNILNNNTTSKNNNVTIVQNITTQDATAFRNSRNQLAIKQQSAMSQASKLL